MTPFSENMRPDPVVPGGGAQVQTEDDSSVTWSAPAGHGLWDFELQSHYSLSIKVCGRAERTQRCQTTGPDQARPDQTRPESIMKFLVALALFSVCNANVVVPAQTSVDLVKSTFWDYVATATQMAEGSLKQLQDSELGQDFNTKLSQSADTVNQYVVALRTQAGPLSQDLLSQITVQAETLKTQLETELSSVSTNLQPMASQLIADAQVRMDELKSAITPLAESMDAESLKAVLLQKSQDLKTSLQAQMGPYTEDIKQKVEQSIEHFQSSLTPLTQSFEVQVQQKVQEVQQSLAPYGEELKAKLEANAQDVRAQVTALWESFTQKTAQ
uniref:Apolipoprotein A-IV n=1 Tax=Knipowitschia caucasica TaxID=637954 RepID=A0AAV2K788_KNICA